MKWANGGFRKLFWAWGALLFLLWTMSCAPQQRMVNLKPNMAKPDAIRVMGGQGIDRGTVTNRYKSVIEIWEYSLSDHFGQREPFYLLFMDERLVHWGKASALTPDIIYEMRFK